MRVPTVAIPMTVNFLSHQTYVVIIKKVIVHMDPSAGQYTNTLILLKTPVWFLRIKSPLHFKEANNKIETVH